MIRALSAIVPGLLTATLLSVQAAPAHANADLFKSKNCAACHAVDKKLIGPSMKDIAAKYAADKDAATKLAKKIREGSTGVWGQIPMPANPLVNADEAATLAKWALTQK